MAGALIATLIAVVAELAPFAVLFFAIEAVLETPQASTNVLVALAPWLFGGIALKYMAYGMAYLISHHAAYSIMMSTRNRLVARLDDAPLHWIHAQGAGALKQSVIQDVERMEAFIAHHTVELAAALMAPLCVTLALLWIDWRLALAALAIGPMALLASAIAMRGVGQNQDRFNHETASLNNVTVEYLRNMPVLKVFCRSASGFRLLRQRLRAYYRLTEQITRNTVPGWALFTSVLGSHLLLLLPLGAWLHTHGEIGIAEVVVAVLLGAGIFRPLLKVGRFLMEMPPIVAGIKRMAPLLALSRSKGQARLAADDAIRIELDQVRFRYGDGEVLAGISLCLEPATFNVLLGPSGSGKSTIAQLVAGLLTPTSGAVTANGVSIADLDDQERARCIALATQEVFLFSGTVRDNLLLACPEASAQEIQRAVRVAQVEMTIQALPLGYDTPLNELGARLSGGERQRLAVARALLADPAVLVLDESTAFADSLTQRAFFQALLTEYPHTTLLVVAHRLYGIEQADQILVLEAGALQKRGRHDHLMAESDYYRSLWEYEELSERWSLGGAAPAQEAVQTSDGSKLASNAMGG
ncbi:MAG: ABC transporter ATP-binding protein [Gammaproteobacteria bacterium]|nr:ABC transporter ATP-binding protein [Gammaproteobacteria bacterium]